LFHLFLFFHLSIGLLLFVCVRERGRKRRSSSGGLRGFKAEGRRKIEEVLQKEGEKFKKQKEGEKLKKRKEGEKFRLLFPHNKNF
jgi:hypothetical protein